MPSESPVSVRRAHRERDPEIGDQRLSFVQQDVGGLDVAMNDPSTMGVVQRLGDLGGEADGLLYAQLLLSSQPFAEGLPFDERHDVKEEAIGFPGIVEGEDIGMLELGGDLDLLEEPLRPDDHGKFLPQNLDGDFAAVLEVFGEIHGGHATRAELAFNTITVGERSREA